MDGPVSTYSAQFGSKFNAAINLALSLGNISVSQKLQLEYQRLNGYSTYFNGYGQKLWVKVTANGSAVQASKVTVVGRAKILRMY
jgi:hypothetical protein